MPGRLTLENGHWVPARADPPREPQVLTAQEVVERALNDLRDGYLKTPETLSQALDQAALLALVMNEIDPELVKKDWPYNSAQVRAGGYAMLRATENEAVARVTKVDRPALGRSLAQLERIRGLRTVADPLHETLEANETHVLTEIFEHVDGGLKVGMSVIQNNGELLRELGPALAIKGRPSEAGQQSKGQNQRLEQKVRADEQGKQAAQPGGEGAMPAATTTTVTTQPAGVPGPQTTTPGPRTHGGHGKTKP